MSIEAHGLDDRLLGVYIRLSDKRKVHHTREVIADVFADFDKQGEIIGIEFTRPGDYNLDAMNNVSRLVNVPELRAIDVSHMPVNINESALVGA